MSAKHVIKLNVISTTRSALIALAAFALTACAPAHDLYPVTASPSAKGVSGNTSRGHSRTVQQDGAEFTMTSSDDDGPRDPSCVGKALAALKKYSPVGYRVWERLPSKNVLEFYVPSCSSQPDFLLSTIPTAVHESVHNLRSYTGAYHLISDEMLPVPDAPGYFPPQEMTTALAVELGKTDDFFSIYIQPNTKKASSKIDFTYLLDEMNAYSNDLQVTMDMTQAVQLENREAGVAAMMTFVAFYARFAQANHPEVYRHMSGNLIMRSALSKLWNQAQTVLLKSCAYRGESLNDDKPYTRFLCDPKKTAAISTALGYQITCPSQCKSTYAEDAVVESKTESSITFTSTEEE